MALTYTSGTNRTDHGSAASLDDLASLTLLIWFNRPNFTTPSVSEFLAVKAGGGVGHNYAFDASGFLSFFRKYATTDATAGATPANLGFTAGEWCYWAVTNEATDGPRLYGGTLTSLAVEAAAYDSRVTGVGALSSDAANTFRTGGTGVANQGADGTIARVMFWNRVLTLAEIQAQQFRPQGGSGLVLWSEYGYAGTGTQPDYSGNGNNGTVTGATVASHVPIPFRRARPIYVPYTVAAGGGGNPWNVYAQQ